MKLRLLGSCDGCPSSVETLRGTVEVAIVEAAPEVTRIVVEESEPHGATARRGADRPGDQAAVRRVPGRVSTAVTDPLAVLQRIREAGRAPSPRPRRCCELCTEPIARRAQPPGRPAHADAAVRLPGLLPALRLRWRRRRLTSAAFPSATSPSPDFELTPAQWDRLQIPVERGLLLPELVARPGGRLLPGPGRRHRVRAAARRLGRGGRRPPAAGLHAARRRGVPRASPVGGARAVPTATADGTECYIVPIDACYELVGHLRLLWRGFDGGHRGQREARRVLRRRAARAAATMSDLRFEVLDARTEPHAAVPTIMFRLRADEADGLRVHAAGAALPDPDRAAAPALQRAEEEKLYELFGEMPQWGDSLRPFLWTHVSTTLGRFDGTTEFDLPVECTYDFEVAGAKYLHALGDGDVPLILLFSGTVFTRGRVGLRGRAALVVGRGLLPHAGGGLAGHDGPLLPRQRRGSACAATRWTTSSASGRARGLPTWDQAFAQLLKEAGSGTTAVEATRRTPWRPHDRFAVARSVADAVLYEGYVLYPYRASSRKNQVRFQWGVLAPQGFSEADGSERWSVPHRVPRWRLAAGPASRPPLGARPLPAGAAPQRRGAGPGYGGRRPASSGSTPRGGRDVPTCAGTRPWTGRRPAAAAPDAAAGR